jgi:serine/threonine-protein kinase RsbW
MSAIEQTRILSRLPEAESCDRESAISRVCEFAKNNCGRSGTNALLIGGARVGKSEILRRTFDRLFNERGEVVPFYYSIDRTCLDPSKFARDFFSQFVAQLLAFKRNDPKLISGDNEAFRITAPSLPDDCAWMRPVIDSFAQAIESQDPARMLRCALSAPVNSTLRGNLLPFVMIDNCHLLGESKVRGELLRALWPSTSADNLGPILVLCGLRRPVVELIPPDTELFDRLETIEVEKVSVELYETFIRRQSELRGVVTSDSTIELMTQQLDRDLFYARAIIDAAASRGAALKSFIDFQRIYTSEILAGRTSRYFDALLRETAGDLQSARVMVNALALISEAASPLPIDAVVERVNEQVGDANELLSRLHSRELLTVAYGFVSASTDPVFSDYVRAKYRSEIAGASQPIAGNELLGEKLKHSYRVMMTRYNRAIELQVVEIVSRFDLQSVPESLLDSVSFDKRYRGLGRLQVRRALADEPERVRLPQTVVVHNLGAGERLGLSFRLFAATGFEGGIYTSANEVQWLIGLVNSREPLDVDTLIEIDQLLEAAVRGQATFGITRVSRWYISKEGFSAIASDRLSSLNSYSSTYAQLDLLQDYLTSLALSGEARAVSEFELIIPVDGDAELIAARTAEQIARTADFDQDSINQIKTALIEACINAAEHGESPDKKIHQRFAIDDNRLIITVSNKGRNFGRANGQSPPSVAIGSRKDKRGRGLQIIRALMDEVEFERTDDGTRLVMTKYLKRPDVN